MRRRSFLRGLLALPLMPVLAPLASKTVDRFQTWTWVGPWTREWTREGTWRVSRSTYLGGGTIDHYKTPQNMNVYTEIRGIPVKKGESIRFTYVRTGTNWE